MMVICPTFALVEVGGVRAGGRKRRREGKREKQQRPSQSFVLFICAAFVSRRAGQGALHRHVRAVRHLSHQAAEALDGLQRAMPTTVHDL